MSIPDEGYPLAAAVSPRLQVTETTDSTNADLVKAVAADPEQWPHLSLIVTTDQRAGRGRLDRTWTAPPGTALAVSVLVRIDGLPVAARGWVPLVAGVAMTRAVRDQLRGTAHRVTVKWPNDVLLNGGKLCGILAEVVPGHPDAVVVGVGVNTRMSPADLPVETATSFAATGLDVDDDRLLAAFLTELDTQLTALLAAGGDAQVAGVAADIESLCSTVGSDVDVALPDGGHLVGRAEGIDAEGRLVVVADGVPTPVAAGDVLHVR